MTPRNIDDLSEFFNTKTVARLLKSLVSRWPERKYRNFSTDNTEDWKRWRTLKTMWNLSEKRRIMRMEVEMEKMMNGSDPCQVKLFRPRKEKVCIWQSDYFFRIHVRLLPSLASYANRVPANSGVFCFFTSARIRACVSGQPPFGCNVWTELHAQRRYHPHCVHKVGVLKNQTCCSN